MFPKQKLQIPIFLNLDTNSSPRIDFKKKNLFVCPLLDYILSHKLLLGLLKS